MAVNADKHNPYPGLRPFSPDEAHLFFGREAHVDELLEKLKENRFCVVLGSSGSGKSSLVLAGLFPALDGGAGGAVWCIARMRPGSDPIGSLARALLDTSTLKRSAEELSPEEAALEQSITETTLKRSHLGLIRAVAELGLSPGERFLLLVDQFEELFRCQPSSSACGDMLTAFVQLLLEASRQTDVPVYILLTLRSEFLGNCVQFAGLAETINAGQYLIPRLNRRQRGLAVTGPARVAGAEISPILLQRLLNDVGDNPDQLPILQHALMRTFDLWYQRGRPEAPIDIADYEKAGEMSEALDRHAEEIFAELSPRQQAIAEALFRSLTERSAEGYGVRRPAPLGEIAAVAGADVDELLAAIEHFRAPGRTFLFLPPGAKTTEETLVDISHESLMRIWNRLTAWTETEAKAAELYRRIAQDAALHAAGESGLWGDPELELAIRWWTAQQPSAAWARRYDAPFELVRGFLEESREARDLEAREKQRIERRELEQAQALAETEQQHANAERRAKKRLRIAVVFISIALLSALLTLVSVLGEYQTKEALEKKSRDLAIAKTAAVENEIEALANGANSQAHAGYRLSAMLEAYRAGRRFESLALDEKSETHRDLRRRVEDALAHALFNSLEKNHWFDLDAWPNTLVFSHDGRIILSGGWETDIRRWAVDSRPLPSLVRHTAPVFALAASPVDNHLASGDGSGVLCFWQGRSLEREVKNAHAGKPVRSLHYRHDGALIASSGDDGRVRFWRPNGEPLIPHATDWGALFGL